LGGERDCGLGKKDGDWVRGEGEEGVVRLGKEGRSRSTLAGR
jgi:hypothetical protein